MWSVDPCAVVYPQRVFDVRADLHAELTTTGDHPVRDRVTQPTMIGFDASSRVGFDTEPAPEKITDDRAVRPGKLRVDRFVVEFLLDHLITATAKVNSD